MLASMNSSVFWQGGFGTTVAHRREGVEDIVKVEIVPENEN